MKKKAVFFDRDGTLNRDVGYPDSYASIDIFPFSFPAVKKIKQAGFLAVIITNQSGIGRGLIQEENLHDIHARLNSAFEKFHASFDGIYHCPHYALSKTSKYRKVCTCRKPNPGMGETAAADLGIDTSLSYMIGDKVEDILFGINIHAVPVLVLTGYGPESKPKLEEMGIQPAYVAKNVLDAVEWIIQRENKLSVS